MRRTNSLAKSRMLGKIGGEGEKGRQTTRWLDGIMGSIDGHEFEMVKDRKPGVLQSMRAQTVRHDCASQHQTNPRRRVLVSLDSSFASKALLQALSQVPSFRSQRSLPESPCSIRPPERTTQDPSPYFIFNRSLSEVLRVRCSGVLHSSQGGP